MKSLWAARMSASALCTSDTACPMSGDWMAASGCPFFTRSPSLAKTAVTRPFTGEYTWATLRSSNVTRPLVTIVSSTFCSSTGPTSIPAAATFSGVRRISPELPDEAAASAASALGLQPAASAPSTRIARAPKEPLVAVSP